MKGRVLTVRLARTVIAGACWVEIWCVFPSVSLLLRKKKKNPKHQKTFAAYQMMLPCSRFLRKLRKFIEFYLQAAILMVSSHFSASLTEISNGLTD